MNILRMHELNSEWNFQAVWIFALKEKRPQASFIKIYLIWLIKHVAINIQLLQYVSKTLEF